MWLAIIFSCIKPRVTVFSTLTCWCADVRGVGWWEHLEAINDDRVLGRNHVVHSARHHNIIVSVLHRDLGLNLHHLWSTKNSTYKHYHIFYKHYHIFKHGNKSASSTLGQINWYQFSTGGNFSDNVTCTLIMWSACNSQVIQLYLQMHTSVIWMGTVRFGMGKMYGEPFFFWTRKFTFQKGSPKICDNFFSTISPCSDYSANMWIIHLTC